MVSYAHFLFRGREREHSATNFLFFQLNDSYELTVTPKTGYIVNMDLFLMYKDVHKNGSVINWVGGASGFY